MNNFRKAFLGLFFLPLVLANSAAAKIIHVPADQPTIQAAINAAATGDMVLVAPGTYTENINFSGKAIMVVSSAGPATTIIDGNKLGSVVIFNSGETRKSILSGFTLQNGNALPANLDGGGIEISGASPIVMHNIIQNNTACDGGGGVHIDFSSALLEGNTIRNNSQSGCSGGVGGGGVAVVGAASAQVFNNIIVSNSWGSAGGGITLFAAGTPTIENNTIARNTAGGQGGGIWLVNAGGEIIVQNLIHDNTGTQGGGIYLSLGSTGQVLVNNTIANNKGSASGSALYTTGDGTAVQIYNNILVGSSGQNAVFCDSTFGSNPANFFNNDAFSSGGGTGLLGDCAGQATLMGNISADPLFVNAAKVNFQLQSGSPAINAGNNSAPHLPAKDLAGKPRIVGGTVDMGAYEFQAASPVALEPEN
jgi:parallel beta-helix repeat protein